MDNEKLFDEIKNGIAQAIAFEQGTLNAEITTLCNGDCKKDSEL